MEAKPRRVLTKYYYPDPSGLDGLITNLWLKTQI